MNKLQRLFKNLAAQKHFYFWLALPITLIIVVVFIWAFFLLANYQHLHPTSQSSYLLTITLQTATVIYVIFLQRSLWFEKNRTAFILFGVVGLTLSPLTIPIEIVMLGILLITMRPHSKSLRES